MYDWCCSMWFELQSKLLVVSNPCECQVSFPHTTQSLCTAVTAIAIATTATSSRTMTANEAVEDDSS